MSQQPPPNPSRRVDPVVATDFAKISTYNDFDKGSLTSPLLFLTWPVRTQEEAKERNSYATARQRRLFERSGADGMSERGFGKGVRFVKVVDGSGGDGSEDGVEIVSLARWQVLREGWKEEKEEERGGDDGGGRQKEKQDPKRQEEEQWPEGLNVKLQQRLFSEMGRSRAECMTSACWVLMTLVTREAYRRQGVGGMLLKWGTDQADRDGLPAWLEATAAAKRLYEAHGFVKVKVIRIESRDLGLDEDFEISVMRREPKEGLGR